MTDQERLIKRANRLETIGFSALAGSMLLLVGNAATMCAFLLPESGNDSGVLRTVNSVAENTERTLLAQGKDSFGTDISDLRIPMDPDSSKTTIQMSGTFNDGYCIVGTNADGRNAEKGIFYSVSKNGHISRDENDCTRGVTNESVVVGPQINKGKLSEPEFSDVLIPAFGGTVGVFILSCIINSKASKTRRKIDELDSGTSNVTDSSGPTPEEVAPPMNTIHETAERVASGDKMSSISRRLEDIKAEWASYELDLVKVLEYPAVTNLSVPATAEFHKALRVAQSLTPEGNELSVDGLSEFNRAVTDLEHRYDVMISEAQRMKWNDYSSKERVSLTMAQNLLSIAMNSASSSNERQIAYKRLIKEVEGIVVLPKKAMLELESKMPAELEMETNSREIVHA